jgi:hypothetical protein
VHALFDSAFPMASTALLPFGGRATLECYRLAPFGLIADATEAK